MNPIIKLIYLISDAVSIFVRFLVLALVAALYAYSFPIVFVMEVTGLVVILTVASFFIEQKELKTRLDEGLIALSGAVLIEDIWYWLRRSPAPRQTKPYNDLFKHSIAPDIFPLAAPIAAIAFSTAFYAWILQDGLSTVWFYLVFTVVSIISVALAEGERFRP